MKKNFIYFMLAASCAVSFMASCNSDDDSVITNPVPSQITFTDDNGLDLTYGGQPVYGKKVIYTPDSKDPLKATLVISGNNLELGGLLAARSNGEQSLVTSGVIPGTLSTTLVLDLKFDGAVAAFEGSATQNEAAINYKGTVSKDKLSLALNVTMPKNDLTNSKWSLMPYDCEEYTTAPVTLLWSSDKNVELIPGYDLPVESILQIAMQLPLIGNEYSVYTALEGVLKTVSFLPDGNIVAEYKDEIASSEAWKTSATNMAMYVASAEQDSTLTLYLNPMQIIKNVEAAHLSRAVTSEIIGNLSRQVIPMLAEGVKLHYSIVGNQLMVYAGTDLLKPLLTAISPVFNDEAFVQQIVDMVLANPDMSSMAPMVGPMLQQLPAIIDMTTDIKAGLNLQKVQ